MTSATSSAAHRQPWLHELSVCVDGNVTALSDGSGDGRGDMGSGDVGSGGSAGAQGVYVDDRRVVSVLRVQLGDEAASPVARVELGRPVGVRRLGPAPRRRRTRPDGRAPPAPAGAAHGRRGARGRRLARVGARLGRPARRGRRRRRRHQHREVGRARRRPLAVSVEAGGLCWADDRHEVRVTCDAPDAVLAAQDGDGGRPPAARRGAGQRAGRDDHRHRTPGASQPVRRRSRVRSRRLGRRAGAGPGLRPRADRAGRARRPAPPAAHRPRGRARRLRRRRHALVPHAVRARLAVDRPAGAAVRHRARRRHLARPRPAPGHDARPGDRAGPRQGAARGAP